MANDFLRLIPLGGLGEIGKNMMVLETAEDIVVIDCGLMFPYDDMLGVDLVIPDTTYLEARADKLRGILITHGHEDHTGALPYVLRKISAPTLPWRSCGTRASVRLASIPYFSARLSSSRSE